MKAKGIIKDFAIMGGVAAAIYIPAVRTEDIDIVALMDDFSDLHKIFEYAKNNKISVTGQSILLGNSDVMFLPTFISNVYYDALKSAKVKSIGQISAKVITPEYLIIFSLIANRAKDKFRISELVQNMNIPVFLKLLQGYDKDDALRKRFDRILVSIQ
jgi:hypothetical protein